MLKFLVLAALFGVSVSSLHGADDKREPDAEKKTIAGDSFPKPLVSRNKEGERMPVSLPVAQPVPVAQPTPVAQAAAKAPLSTVIPDDGKPQVVLVAIKTDAAKRYKNIIPPLPIPPFTRWRQWFREHENAVHCVLEWRNDKGEWWHGELRSTHFSVNKMQYRVGFGEFPGTGYDAYGIFLLPGRIDRDKNERGEPVEIAMEEVIQADYRRIEEELKSYGAKQDRFNVKGRKGDGKTNVGLGGPAYKPTQNSNTMVKYILRACGVNHPTPDLAVGWDAEPQFPYSSDADMPANDLP